MIGNVNILSTNDEMTELTNAAYGDQRLDYTPFFDRLAANSKRYDTIRGGEQKTNTISYQVTQKFPEDEFAARFKEASTELAQVHARPTSFSFFQFTIFNEMKIGNAGRNQRTELSSQIIKNFFKLYDDMAFNGGGGNFGYKTHPNTTIVAVSGTIDFDFIKTQIDGAINRIKTDLDLTSSQLSGIRIAWGSGVENIMTSIDANQLTTNKQRLYDAYPEIAQSSIFEMNSFLINSLQMIVTYAPVCTVHSAAMPSAVSEESSKYGLGLDLLFGTESVGIDVEAEGGCQVVNMSAS